MHRIAPLLLFPLLLSVAALADEDPLVRPKREIRAIRDADLVVVAEVERVHRGPEIWCGILATRQEVSWKVLEVVSSSLPAGTGPDVGKVVRVGHLLVGGGLVHSDYPAVRSELIHRGARAILLLSRRERLNGETEQKRDVYEVQDEAFGVRLLDPPLRPDPDRKALLAALLELDELSAYLHPEVPGRRPIRFALTKALPDPVPGLRMFDLPVLFLPEDELARDPHLRVTKLAVGAKEATIAFRYDAEGVVGRVTFKRSGNGWVPNSVKIAER